MSIFQKSWGWLCLVWKMFPRPWIIFLRYLGAPNSHIWKIKNIGFCFINYKKCRRRRHPHPINVFFTIGSQNRDLGVRIGVSGSKLRSASFGEAVFLNILLVGLIGATRGASEIVEGFPNSNYVRFRFVRLVHAIPLKTQIINIQTHIIQLKTQIIQLKAPRIHPTRIFYMNLYILPHLVRG
mgnify:CR=1 FL=1